MFLQLGFEAAKPMVLLLDSKPTFLLLPRYCVYIQFVIHYIHKNSSLRLALSLFENLALKNTSNTKGIFMDAGTTTKHIISDN